MVYNNELGRPLSNHKDTLVLGVQSAEAQTMIRDRGRVGMMEFGASDLLGQKVIIIGRHVDEKGPADELANNFMPSTARSWRPSLLALLMRTAGAPFGKIGVDR